MVVNFYLREVNAVRYQRIYTREAVFVVQVYEEENDRYVTRSKTNGANSFIICILNKINGRNIYLRYRAVNLVDCVNASNGTFVTKGIYSAFLFDVDGKDMGAYLFTSSLYTCFVVLIASITRWSVFPIYVAQP